MAATRPDPVAKLAELGHALPPPPAKGGMYAPCKLFGTNLAYVSGCGPAVPGQTVTGKLGASVTLEQGQRAALNCMLNVLSVLDANVGGLHRVKSFVKIITFVASDDGFTQQPQVANGGTQLLKDLFGESGLPARSAVGVNVLPGDISVETEALVELWEE